MSNNHRPFESVFKKDAFAWDDKPVTKLQQAGKETP
jgi:hypothetical protein